MRDSRCSRPTGVAFVSKWLCNLHIPDRSHAPWKETPRRRRHPGVRGRPDQHLGQAQFDAEFLPGGIAVNAVAGSTRFRVSLSPFSPAIPDGKQLSPCILRIERIVHSWQVREPASSERPACM